MAAFGWRERPLGPWDHKPELRNLLGLTAEDHHFPIRGVRGAEARYDLWSNIHYGYVGRAAGIPGRGLRRAAAMEGRDDAADRISVRIGVGLWNKHGNHLTPRRLHRAILSAIPAYQAAERLIDRPDFLERQGNGF